MDPKTAWQGMWVGFEDVNPEQCWESGEALSGWLLKGGFWPEGMTTPGGEQVADRQMAGFWVRKLQTWAEDFMSAPVDEDKVERDRMASVGQPGRCPTWGMAW